MEKLDPEPLNFTGSLKSSLQQVVLVEFDGYQNLS